jgi:DNA-binding response OmpR family regulator
MELSREETGKVHVLVVEDEFLIAEWVAESLTEQGFDVRTASNAGEALRQLASAPVDVLLTDINLPGGMDGTALARRAREMSPQLPVIYASARVGTLAAEARVPGALLLCKPYGPETLGRVIAGAVQSVKRPVFA